MSGYVYILTNDRKTVLYTGVTSNLKGRVHQHKSGSVAGFTKKYNVKSLVYYEVLSDMYNAISREKQLKAGSRAKKEQLINSLNPEWLDLYYSI